MIILLYIFKVMSRRPPSPATPMFIALANCLNSITTERSLKQSKSDVFALVQRIGVEGETYVMRFLMELLEATDPKDKTLAAVRSTLLAEVIKQYALDDHFQSYFPELLAKVAKETRVPQFITGLLGSLKLPLSTQITIALSLYLSDRPQLIAIGQSQLIQKLKQYHSADKTASRLPERLLDELLFQININPQLSNKLTAQNKMLLDAAEKMNKGAQTRIYNYFREEWQYFANETAAMDKPAPVALKKSDILRDLGPSVTSTIETIKSVAAEIGILNEEDIFQCIMMMAGEKNRPDNGLDRFVTDLMYANSSTTNKKAARGEEAKKLFNIDLTNKKAVISWNVDIFLAYCSQSIANIKWQNVFSNFDREGLAFVSDEHFLEVLRIFEKIKKLAKKWSYTDSILYRKWTHPESQAQFLYQLFSCKQPEYLFSTQPQTKKAQGNSKEVKNSQRDIWGELELVCLLFQVSEHKRQKIKQLFDVPISKYPEQLIKTLSEIKPAQGQGLLSQIYLRLLPQFLETDNKSTSVVDYLWQSNKQMLIKSISLMHKNGPKRNNHINLDKFVQIFQNIEGSLEEIIASADFSNDLSFVLPLALVAGKRQCVNFEKWLGFRLEKNENKFFKEMVAYLESFLFKPVRAATHPDQKEAILEESNLTVEMLNKIFSILIEKLKKDSSNSKNVQTLKKLHKECCQYFPEVAEGQISQQAERQSEQEIKKIYKQQVTIAEAVDKLKALKNSTKKQEREQFANRITFLCIELTYHHSYPEKQLMITAELFSALINANLIEKKILQVFLHVLDQYLKQDNQRFAFALKVMEKTKDKLAGQGWFCEKLIENDLMLRKDPQLVEVILKSIEPPKLLPIEKQRRIKEAIRIKKAVETVPKTMEIEPEVHRHTPLHKEQFIEFDILSTLDKTKRIELPDRENKLRLINTIFNTLSITNLEDKAKELSKLLDSKKMVKLFSFNLIFKRLTMTHNNGIEVYVKLLEKLPDAIRPVMNVVYKILENWFNLSGKSVNDKKFSHFKNIGYFLGRTTVGMGLPVPIYRLNIREILKKSFKNNNRLNFNIPVVLKILQLSEKFPQVFRLQSPWFCMIVRILNQIQSNMVDDHQIKNEIKAFFKTLQSIDLQKYVKHSPAILFNETDQIINQLLQVANISEQSKKISLSLKMPNIENVVVIAIANSIKEILEQVSEKTLKIVKLITKSLIRKDFSTQNDCNKYSNAASTLAKEMAAPWAQNTARELLKNISVKSLSQMLEQPKRSNQMKNEDFDNLIQKLIADNLEAGCLIVRQRVAKIVEWEIKRDQEILMGIELRKKCKNEGRAFKDEKYLESIPTIVPQELRPSPNGLNEQQYLIYHEMSKGIGSSSGDTQKLKKQNTAAVQSISNMITQREPVEKLKTLLLNEAVPEHEILYKLHTSLLEDVDNDSDLQYFLKLCLVVRTRISDKTCWEKFKELADLRLKETQRIVRKLAKQKYFSQAALDEMNEQERKSVGLFQKWVRITKGEQKNFISQLKKSLAPPGEGRQFFDYCLRHCMKKLTEGVIQNQKFDTFNGLYIQRFAQLVVEFYASVTQDSDLYIKQILALIFEVFLTIEPRYSIKSYQRAFFKTITSITTLMCTESGLKVEKVSLYISGLAKQLQGVNPLVKPAFAFSWLQFLYNKYFIRYLLQSQQHWELYFNLLSLLLKFIKTNVTVDKLYDKNQGKPYQMYYQVALKLIILLVHDYSGFVSAYSLELCLLVDSQFIQLRNIILSALPKKSVKYTLKFNRREDLEELAKEGGYPVYHKLVLDRQKLDYYLKLDVKDPKFMDAFQHQDELFLQTFVLYMGWLPECRLSQAESTRKLTQLISHSPEQLRIRLLNYCINLIRYPNLITLFFIDFTMHLIFKQTLNAGLRGLMLENIILRMKGENPLAWGLFYLVDQFEDMKRELKGLGISDDIIDQL